MKRQSRSWLKRAGRLAHPPGADRRAAGHLTGMMDELPMLKRVTRSRLIQVWFMVAMSAIAIGIVLGGAPALGTVAMLLTLSLVPPTIVLFLWPRIQPPTASEVLHGIDRRW